MLLLLTVAVTACGSNLSTHIRPTNGYRPSTSLQCDTPDAPFVPEAAVLADAQLSNYYGARLLSGSLVADSVVTRVAFRPPALDLWSDVVLSAFVRETVEDLRQGMKGERSPLLLFLGDSTNIACTGEFQRFVDVMEQETRGASWLMVHGNHDSFMMGNFNSWGRHNETSTQTPQDFLHDSDGVRDITRSDSEYTAAECRQLAYGGTACSPRPWSHEGRSWAAACAEPNRESVPMYKATWLRRYLRALETQGVALRADGVSTTTAPGGPLDASVCAHPRRIEGTAAEGTALAARKYRLDGWMYSRQRLTGDAPCPALDNECDSLRASAYRSYVVQSLELNDSVRLVLIDTDHRHDDVRSNASAYTNAAGKVGRIDPAQWQDIEAHVGLATGAQRIIFLSHHPLQELPEETRQKLLEFKPLAHLSAHTHYESSAVIHQVNEGAFLELNVGSTTDWPMEAMLLGAEAQRLSWRVLGVREPSELDGDSAGKACGYRKVRFHPGAEECTKRFGHRDTFTAYKSKPSRYHNLCHLREELSRTAARWPGSRSAFATLERQLPWNSLKSDPLRAYKGWRDEAGWISDTVEALREAALRQEGDERAFALCEAVEASRQEAETRGWFDSEVERSDHVQPAAHHSGATEGAAPPPR